MLIMCHTGMTSLLQTCLKPCGEGVTSYMRAAGMGMAVAQWRQMRQMPHF
jgi:hypothetical protein